MRQIETLAASALLALAVFATPESVSAQQCLPSHPCGDVDASDAVTVGDALRVLRRAVNLPTDLACSCGAIDECVGGAAVATGQTMCWDPLDTTNPIDPVDCPGTGQDGDTKKGLPLDFVDNGNGTVTDNNTGLMWEKLSDDGTIHDFDNFAYLWAGAFGKITDLNKAAFAGYTDWRIPQARELETLIDFSSYNPSIGGAFNFQCKPGCTILTCSCTKAAVYWSSTTYQNTPSSAWSINFQTGSLVSTAKTAYSYLRAVRGGY